METQKAHNWAKQVEERTDERDGDRIELVLPRGTKESKVVKRNNTGAYTYVTRLNDTFGLAQKGDDILYLFANRRDNVEIKKAINHTQETEWVNPRQSR